MPQKITTMTHTCYNNNNCRNCFDLSGGQFFRFRNGMRLTMITVHLLRVSTYSMLKRFLWSKNELLIIFLYSCRSNPYWRNNPIVKKSMITTVCRRYVEEEKLLYVTKDVLFANKSKSQ